MDSLEWKSTERDEWPPMYSPFLAKTVILFLDQPWYGYAALTADEAGNLRYADAPSCAGDYACSLSDGAFTEWAALPLREVKP